MPTILHLDASIRGEDESVTRSLSGKLVAGLKSRLGAKVITRDLAANDLPFIDAARFAAGLAAYDERSAQQHGLAAIGDRLIAEIEAADVIVIGAPIYNFGAPATLKAWADLVARAGTTFRYTSAGPEGLLKGKKAYVAVASGGTPVGSTYDLMTPWLIQFLGFIGISDVEIIAADAVMGAGGEEKIAFAHEKAEALAA